MTYSRATGVSSAARLGGYVTLWVTLLTALGCRDEPPQLPPPPHAADHIEGFRYAEPGRALSFPADYGAHPDYQTEWWYYTGNLRSEERHFGYQLTFFRRSLQPPAARVQRTASLASDEVYMAHFAITDSSAGDHQVFERFSRSGGDLAGARAAPYAVWLDDWQVHSRADGSKRLSATAPGYGLELELGDAGSPVTHGIAGYSRKGEDPQRASHYYTLPQIPSRGTIVTPAGRFSVKGASWMDHEFTSSGLADHQIGWDWFSVQLEDGSSLMLFHLRTADGGVDVHSSGTWMPAGAAPRPLAKNDFAIQVDDTWLSPHTGGRYPAAWQIEVAELDLVLRLRPTVADQEIVQSFVYWEGAVRVDGTLRGRRLDGAGYVELTGYAVSMAGAF